MKKVLFILVLVLLCFGCKTFSMDGAQDTACNPPPDVVAVANAVAPAVAMVLNTAVPGSALFISAANAQSYVSLIQKGACLSVTQVNELIKFIQGPEVMMARAKIAKGGKVAAIDVTPLKTWATRKK